MGVLEHTCPAACPILLHSRDRARDDAPAHWCYVLLHHLRVMCPLPLRRAYIGRTGRCRCGW